MIRLIGDLIEKGYAYITLNGIYFRVKKFVEYGKLSKKPLEELESGSRIEVDNSKEDPLDFALWKFHSNEPHWTSPWGRGRPGWHIECSAMALKYFGSSFEIHGGGQILSSHTMKMRLHSLKPSLMGTKIHLLRYGCI